MSWTVRVDREKCIGCGLCVELCSENFSIDDNGKAVVTNPVVKEASCNKEAAENCPVDAIEVKGKD